MQQYRMQDIIKSTYNMNAQQDNKIGTHTKITKKKLPENFQNLN